jgi:predicted Ser/Thr protein kinase
MTATPDADFIAFQRALAGQYSLERELGRGGMGIVYLAREVSLDRLVAVKLLPPSLAVRPELRDRFVREARTAAKLSHPNIVPIYGVSENAGFVYFVMAYVDGETLTQRVRARGPRPPHEVSRLLREVAWALAYAHARGVVHRDVKPDNILLEHATSRALVTDFGIAHVANSAAYTGDGLVMGTAQYMSPEQAAAEPVDGRSDLYSLGIVAHFALTGKLPFDAPNASELLIMHLTKPAPSVAVTVRGVPRELAQVVDRCLAKDPAARFATGEALADALTAPETTWRHLPVPLRVWLEKRDPLIPLYPVWGVMMVVPGSITLANALIRALPASRGYSGLAMIAAGVVVPFIAHAKVRLWETRRALAAGLTIDDLRWGLRDYLRSRREEMSFDLDQPPSLPGKILRGIAYGGLAVLAGTTATLGFWPTIASAKVLGYLAGISAIASLSATVLGLAIPGRRLSGEGYGRDRERFWNGRLGALATKIAGFWLKRPLGGAAIASRPTEIAIGLAADHLFSALPKATRKQLGDVPALLRTLESDAQTLRARVADLDGRIADLARVDDPARQSTTLAARDGSALAAQRSSVLDDLQRSRDQSAARLGNVVAALENIRLDLLRLHSGAADAQSITAIVEQTHRLARDVDVVIDAQKEVERALS